MENISSTQLKNKKLKLDFKDSKYATGRRKSSVAKVWLKKGSGVIHVNGLKMNEYFKSPFSCCIYGSSFKCKFWL